MVDKKKFLDDLDEYLKDKKEQHDKADEYNEILHKKSAAHYVEELKKEKIKNKSFVNVIKKIIVSLKLKEKFYKFGKSNKEIINKEKAVIGGLEKKFVIDVKSIVGKIVKKGPNGFKRDLTKKDKIKLIAFTTALASLVIGVISINNVTTAYQVSYKGEKIGIVNSKNEVLNKIENITGILDAEYDAEIVISEENFEFLKVRKMKFEYITEEELLGHFTYAHGVDVQGYGVFVDGEEHAFFSKKADAELLLEELKGTYVDLDDEYTEYETIGFLEDVKISEVEREIEKVNDLETTIEYILKGTNEKRIHTVKKGENYWSIADKYNIKPGDLEDANPNVDPTRLQIGQDISLIVPKPLVTVVTTEKMTYFENISYGVTYENTSALYKGENETKIRGKYGKKEVLAEVERQNGIETTRRAITEKVIEEPKTQTVLVGTKALPPLIGTGSFDNPTRGRLTSKYGMRWGALHTGIDVAAPLGTTIRAADGGVVTYAGWKGNYGLLVIIDHGQNKSTYYAHNSKIVVTKGTKVYKGQKITEMGSTGRSTGPHVHFEIRINGTPTNPQKYVSY